MTRKGTQCTRSALPGGVYCASHVPEAHMPEEEMEKYGLRMVAKGVEVNPYETLLANLKGKEPEIAALVEVILEQNDILTKRLEQSQALIEQMAKPRPTVLPPKVEAVENAPIVKGYKGTKPIDIAPKFLVQVMRTDGTDNGYFQKELCTGMLLQIDRVMYFIPNGRVVRVPVIVRDVLAQRDMDMEGVYKNQQMLNGKHEYGTIRLGG